MSGLKCSGIVDTSQKVQLGDGVLETSVVGQFGRTSLCYEPSGASTPHPRRCYFKFSYGQPTRRDWWHQKN